MLKLSCRCPVCAAVYAKFGGPDARIPPLSELLEYAASAVLYARASKAGRAGRGASKLRDVDYAALGRRGARERARRRRKALEEKARAKRQR